MANIDIPPPGLLRQLLQYDPQTGDLFWLPRSADMFSRPQDHLTWNKKFSGQPALTALVAGYRHGWVLKAQVRAHRVIWALQTGEWPIKMIDHINGNRSDNRWSNLRLVDATGNARNRAADRRNTSGHMGVTWNKATNSWRAQIRHNGKNRFLGLFEDLAKAAQVANAARIEAGFHRNHGRSS